MALAPRDHAGRVEFESDASILAPVDRRRCSGRVMLDVVNRGNTVAVPNFNRATRPTFVPGADPNPPVDPGDGFLMRRGFVVISCGWQIDLPEVPGLLGLRGPEALDANGHRLTGRVYTQLQTPMPATHLLLSDRGHRPYPAADLDEREAILLVRDQPDGDATTIDRRRWRFARVAGGEVVADTRYIWLEGGFEKGRLYQVAYTAIGAPVLGLGIAALRDSAAWLKHGTVREGNPAPDILRNVYAYGRSQTGRLLRTLVYNDLNLDEQGREALDGIIANVAGGLRGEFNQRFGQNSKDRPHMMDYVQPATDEELNRRLVARASRLKAFYTNSSAEYHRGDASLAHTNAEGTRDVPSGPSARIYHFAGTEHGLGVWPLAELEEHDRLRAAPARLSREPGPVGHRGRRAAAEPPSAIGRHHRRALRGAPRGVRSHPRRPLSAPPRASVPPRFLGAAAAPGTGVRLARLRRRRRRQRDRRRRAAGDHRSARRSHGMDAQASLDRRRHAAPGLRRRDHSVRADSPRTRILERSASLHRGALPVARRLPGAIDARELGVRLRLH